MRLRLITCHALDAVVRKTARARQDVKTKRWYLPVSISLTGVFFFIIELKDSNFGQKILDYPSKMNTMNIVLLYCST